MALRAGDGIFETLKVVAGRPFALGHHLERMRASAAALGLPEPDQDEVARRVAEAVAGESAPLLRVRVTWTAPGLAVAVAVAARPPAPAAYVVTAPWPRDERGALAGHKTTAYAGEVVALARAAEHGADEALLADTRGRLSEGATTNVFYVVGGELRTPSLATGCLPGVTRALVLAWWGAVETEEPLEEVRRRADEVFVTSSLRDVQPVRRWDDRELGGPGEVTRRVQARWRERAPELDGR